MDGYDVIAEDQVNDFQCIVCLDILKSCMVLSCKHRLCVRCLTHIPKDECPYCKAPIMSNAPDHIFERKVETTKVLCSTCEGQVLKIRPAALNPHSDAALDCTAAFKSCFVTLEVPLKEYDKHSDDCNLYKFPVASSFVPIPPSRSDVATYICPYCLKGNLDADSLIAHVVSVHSDASEAHTCPICAALPWGDPTFKSGNLPVHLEKRHKCKLDDFVNFTKSEEEMVQMAVEQSFDTFQQL